MNKEEILAKAQKNSNKMDEREISLNQKAATLAFMVCMLCSFVLVVFNILHDQLYQDMFAVYSATLGVYYGYQWWKKRELLLLLDMILFLAAAVMLTVGYVGHVLEV